jgi:hypothetical protein
MTATIVNAAPMTVMLGTNDLSNIEHELVILINDGWMKNHIYMKYYAVYQDHDNDDHLIIQAEKFTVITTENGEKKVVQFDPCVVDYRFQPRALVIDLETFDKKTKKQYIVHMTDPTLLSSLKRHIKKDVIDDRVRFKSRYERSSSFGRKKATTRRN